MASGVGRTEVIFIGLDDTDVAGAPGTNKLARRMAGRLAERWHVRAITRHQLLVHPDIPYTKNNSSAAIMLCAGSEGDWKEIARMASECIRAWRADGSDPGLCVVEKVGEEVMAFGRRAQEQVLQKGEALALALRCGVHAEELGGTGGGVIGALAAVGLAATGDDGRIVQLGHWPDDLSGRQPAETLRQRGVDLIVSEQDGAQVEPESVDVGKRLRPNYRGGRVVLYVELTPDGWQALRKP